MTPLGGGVVRESYARDVKRGETIWAHNDSDWLKVAGIRENDFEDIQFSRADGSIAEFEAEQVVLVLADVV